MRFFILMCWVLLLSWATNFVASPVWRTPVTQAQLLLNTDASIPAGWESRGPATQIIANADGVLSVQRDINKRGRIFRHIELPEEPTLLRLQATLHANTPAMDRFTWYPSSVLFLRVPEGVKKFPFVKRPMFFQSTLKLDEVIELKLHQDTIEISFLQPPQTDWQLSELSLSAVDEHPRYTISRYILAGLWLITLCIGVYRAWRRARVPTVIVVGVLSTLLGGVLASSDAVTAFFTFLRTSLNNLGSGITSGQFSSMMQSGHVVLFAVLTLVVLMFHKSWNLLYTQVVVGIGVLAVATEALQRHAMGRSPDVQDFLFDVFGVIVGLLIYAVFRMLFKGSLRLLSEPS